MKKISNLSNSFTLLGGFLLVIFAVVLFACGKENFSNDEKVEAQSEETEIVTEEYVYQGVSYFLQYDESDETGQPLPSNSVSDLFNAIGEQDYYCVEEGDGKIYIYNDNSSDIDFIDIESKNTINFRSPIMTYFEHDFGQGKSLCGEDVSGIICKGTDCCSKLWYQADLRDVPKSNGGSWNDVISSLFVTGEPLDLKVGDEFTIMFYRDAGFPYGGCQRKGYKIHQMLNDELILQRLRRHRWCPFGGRMNDDIAGWTLVLCRAECNDCWKNPS